MLANATSFLSHVSPSVPCESIWQLYRQHTYLTALKQGPLHTCVFRTIFRTLRRATHGPHGRESMRFVSTHGARRGSCAIHEVLQISRVSLPRAYVGWDSLRGFAEVKPRMWTPFGLTCLPQTSSANMCERGPTQPLQICTCIKRVDT